MSTQVNLDALQDWAESIGAEVAVYRNRKLPTEGGSWEWNLRVRFYSHKQQSLRTLSGDDVEETAKLLLPLAKVQYEQRKTYWDDVVKAERRKHKNDLRRDFAEMERMHMTAEDF